VSGQIIPGKKAPSLDLHTTNGHTWSLDEHFNKTKCMIVFYRGLHCPVCSVFLKQIDIQLLEYKKSNTEVIAISMDSKEKALKAKSLWSINNLNIAYGLTEGNAREWGLYISKSIKEAESDLFCEPGLFVIKEDGTVYLANTSNMPWARPDLTDFPAKLFFAQENDYPVRGNY